MPPANLTLSSGSVIHIQDFQTTGYAPKNKFAFILGLHNTTTALAFLITSQSGYLQTYRARELVHIPVGTTKHFKKDCYIQCFSEVLRLDVPELNEGFNKGKIHWVCDLKAFLAAIKDVVEQSDVLSPQDMEDILKII